MAARSRKSETEAEAAPDTAPAENLEELVVRARARRTVRASEVMGGEDAPPEHVHDFDRSVGTVTRPRTIQEATDAGLNLERLGSDTFPLLVCSCGARVLGDRIS